MISCANLQLVDGVKLYLTQNIPFIVLGHTSHQWWGQRLEPESNNGLWLLIRHGVRTDVHLEHDNDVDWWVHLRFFQVSLVQPNMFLPSDQEFIEASSQLGLNKTQFKYWFFQFLIGRWSAGLYRIEKHQGKKEQ